MRGNLEGEDQGLRSKKSSLLDATFLSERYANTMESMGRSCSEDLEEFSILNCVGCYVRRYANADTRFLRLVEP